MEKIKNLLNPGAKHDEEVMYGSGKSSDPVHSGSAGTSSGQGSHFGSSQAGQNPISSAKNPTPSDVSSGSASNPVVGGQQSGLGGNATSRSGPSGAFDDGASTASIKSGIPGHSQSGSGLIGSSGINDPVNTNKPLPTAPAAGLAGGSTTAGQGFTGAGMTGSGLPDRSVGSSGLGSSLLGRDAAVGAGAVGGAGLAEHERYGDRAATGTGVGSERVGDGIGSGVQGYGPEHWEHDHQHHGHRYEGDPCAHGNVGPPGLHLTSGPHATDTANRLDPHVAGYTGPLETTAGTEGRGTSMTGAGVPLSGAETGIGASGTGYDSRSEDRHLGREAALAGGVGTTGVGAYEAEKHQHSREEPGRTSGLSGTTAGTTGRDYDSTRGAFVPATDNQTSTGHHHHGRDAGVIGAGAVAGAELSQHESERHRKDEAGHEGKKHGGILGFLHHDKDSKSDPSAGAGSTAYESEKHDHERNRLHKDPPEGYASQVTGGTGTTVLAEGNSVQRGPHISGVGNKLDPSVAGRGDSLPPGEVIEPHTGLPINVGKYGTGAGGTDDTPVPGYHKHNNP